MCLKAPLISGLFNQNHDQIHFIFFSYSYYIGWLLSNKQRR